MILPVAFRPRKRTPIDNTWILLGGILGGGFLATLMFLVISLVPTLQQVRRTAAAVEDLVRKVSEQVDPTLHEARGLVRDAASLSRRVEGDLKVVSHIVEDVSDTTGYARELAARIKTEMEQPLLGILSTFLGLRRGVEAYKSYREKHDAPRNPFRKRAR